MSWIAHRNAIIAIAVVVTALLFDIGKPFGLGLSDKLFGFGIDIAKIAAIGTLYIAFAIWRKYI